MRPGPLADGVAEAGADGVLDDVAARRVQVALALDRPRREPVREQMPETSVPLVERLRVAALEALDAAREVGPGAAEDEVVVRRHQAEGVERPAVALRAGVDVGQERAPVVVVAEDRAAVHAPGHHVEVAVRKRGSRHARHGTHQTSRSAVCRLLWTDRRTLLTADTFAQDVSRVRPWFSRGDGPPRAHAARAAARPRSRTVYEIEVGWYEARKPGR
jgi:hypothetical protein